ncbi:MAG: DUF934 domain-containing protein [Kiloniellales bacterium]
MPLIKHGTLAEDPWVQLDDATPIAPGDHAIVSLERWQAERDPLLQRNAPIGLRLRSDQSPALIAEDVTRFAVIALEFPKFTDGRAYSYARLLRERYGFEGELRAVGAVLRDQFAFMARCGFDAFEVADAGAVEAWQEAAGEISVRYQPATDGELSVLALRRLRAQQLSPEKVRAEKERKETAREEPKRRSASSSSSGGRSPAPALNCAADWAY